MGMFNRKPSPASNGKANQTDPGDVGGKEPSALELLQTLVELERESRDLLERREAERLATETAEAERRLVAAEAALLEGRVRNDQQREAQGRLAEQEQALAEARSEVERMADEIGKARREAEEARKEIKPRAERRIAEVQQTLAEARAETDQERERREELEARLEEVEQSARGALETFERELLASEAKKSAEAERRIAELEETLDEVQAEAESERVQRAEIEQRLEALAALEADARQTREQQLAELERRRADAERAAAEAREAMRRERAERNTERERILAIERQLQALVAPKGPAPQVPGQGQEDPESLTAEPFAPPREDPVDVEGDWEVEEPAPEVIRDSGPALDTLQADQPETEQEASMPEAEELTAEELSEIPPDREGIPPPRRRRIGKRQFRKQAVVCAVCKSTLEGESPNQLKALGWTVLGGDALCPDCTLVGWQLPEGEGLPFRRSTEKQRSS
jgi:hypothetical protein